MFTTSVGTSDVVSSCDCRHVRDDAESHIEDLMKTTMTTIQHRALRIVWSCFSFFHCTTCLYSRCSSICMVSCLLLGGVIRPCIGLCSKPDRQKKGCEFFSSFAIHRNASMSDCVYPCSFVRMWHCSSSSWSSTIVPYFKFFCNPTITLTPLNILQC